MRIREHAVLGPAPSAPNVTIYFNGQPLPGVEGEPIAATLMAAGVFEFSRTHEGEPRGVYCAIGRCTDCVMVVNGVPGVRTCITPVEDGMRIETQIGWGDKIDTD